MKRILITTILLLATTAYAADTNFSVTLNRSQLASYEFTLDVVNDKRAAQEPPLTALTMAQFVQLVADAQGKGSLFKMKDTAKKDGLEFTGDEIHALPIVNSYLHFVSGNNECLIKLNGTATPSVSLLDDPNSKCSTTKGTNNKFNIYWDATNDRYEMESGFNATITPKILLVE